MKNKWELELKKYVARKHKEATGEDLSLDAIKDVSIDFNIDFNSLAVKDLANMYSFCLMMEKYERAEEIHSELKSRGCEIEIDINDKRGTGIINVKAPSQDELIKVDMIVLDSGIMVDFDKLD
jgi:hypothetical protein